MKLQESGENYLETILLLQRKKGAVRSVDIAAELSFSKPSISRAVGLLKSGGFVTVDDFGLISLTELGKERAEQVYARHLLLTRFLTRLGVPDDIADADACRIEHVISETSFEAIQTWMAADKDPLSGSL